MPADHGMRLFDSWLLLQLTVIIPKNGTDRSFDAGDGFILAVVSKTISGDISGDCANFCRTCFCRSTLENFSVL
jgi:hypothetical protein